MKVKYLAAALLIIALLLGGCASAAPTEGTTEPPVTDAPVTEAPTTEAPATEATEATEATTDEALAEARRRENLPEVVRAFEDSLPEIARSGENAEQIRQRLDELYGEKKEDGIVVLNDDYSFTYYISGEVLSVVIRLAYSTQIDPSEDFDAASNYTVYTLHIGDGAAVTAEELLRLAGVAEEEFYRLVAVGTGNWFCEWLPDDYLDSALRADDPVSPQPLVECFNETIGDEYVHRAVPYLNDDGELWFAGYVRQMAGATYRTVLLPCEQPEEFSPFYTQVLALASDSVDAAP